MLIKADGSRWLLDEDGREHPYRTYHLWRDRAIDWWRSRGWRRRQAEFRRTGTRYYGDGGTIHKRGHLDVEVYKGRVVSAWFRCQALPFRLIEVDKLRARDMTRAYKESPGVSLHGIEVKDLSPDPDGKE